MKTIAVVPSRGGSKGLPGKNLKRIKGQTLIRIALDQGRRVCDHAVLVTDSRKHHLEASQGKHDSYHIIREVGDSELPEVKTREAIRLFRELFAEYDTIVRLFPTQPLRSDDDIARAINRYAETKTPVVGVSRAPFRVHQLLEPVADGVSAYRYRYPEHAKSPRQEIREPDVYANGTVYVNSIEDFLGNAFWGPPVTTVEVHPLRAIDIDTYEDLRAVRALWPNRLRLWGLRP